MFENTEAIRQFSKKSSGVTLKNITKLFPTPEKKGETIAVNHIDLDIADGELVTLLGPSGCGKTTTLRMISGFEYPSEGQILIGGKDVAKVPPNKRGISMVFQSYALFPHMSIWENVAYGLKVQRLSKNEVLARTNKVIELMQLTGMERRFPNQLSGGQQQRVALARAIVIEPSVLLFDEPLSNLDAKLREHMRDELRSLQKRLGITSLYVTHDQGEAMAISDRVVIMKDGDLMQIGTPKDIYEYPSCKFVANFIGKANFISGIYEAKEDEAALVRIGDRSFKIPNPGKAPVRPGEKCCLTFRPESVKLSVHEEGIPGTIRRVTFLGSNMEYELELADTVLVIEIYNPQLHKTYAEGEKVNAVLDMECVRVLPDSPLDAE
ncbi:Fe(3+) ions import ATP-binding protein FbpC [Treponema primitia ZAS-2]|uniref:Spermidine/putrescine import ATP-binding protein PotA n=1 Tax=Treponema primitia (strain ATCC BAA-887 / DSM 12427 / ZAS-2) TaxID=545694 RepID=F5YKF4_TREPZ|nr:ABC transporter ATP-binding protein [Treponema primitia]AEF85747.1 Fe(3+) ions import ATP-binding protein FbpC [Treponema primitia ZAS-2]